MQTNQERKALRKSILQELKALQAPPHSSPQQQIDSLVKQADFYANFLLSRFQGKEGNEEDGQQGFTRLTQQPSILQGGQLKYYQLVALNWMISLYQSGISGILADDMGLGKTIQSISMLAYLAQFRDITGPHLIIAPKITLGNWMRELKKWLPSARSLRLAATRDERQQGLAEIEEGEFDVVVTSYEGVRLGVGVLRKVKWKYVVIDQAHKLKNQDSQLAQVVRKLNTDCKLLLTGTPLQNNLHQLWSLMNYLIPQVFASSDPFDTWASSQQGDGGVQQQQRRSSQMVGQLHKILRPFMLRRTKAQVQKSLPGKKQILVYVGLSDLQLKIYKNLLQKRSASQQDKKHYMNLLMQLRKTCSHPYLFPNMQPPQAPPIGQHLIQSCGKLKVLDKLLNKLYHEGQHKILIFSQMTSILDILQDYCQLRLYKYCRIDGSTDMQKRDTQIELFMNNNQYFIFLLSTRAGGLGINLTAADIVIIYDSDFNPQMDLQAMDRAHRIGQKRQVRVYRLITQDTVQQKIIQRQMIKLKWDSLVIQQQRTSHKNKSINKQQMKQMLQYGANVIFTATANTITDQLIDQLLSRGEARTNALQQHLQQNINNNNDINLSMDNINIFDFMQRDQEKRRKDKESLENNKEILLFENQLRGRRDKARQVRIKVEKNITLSQHHFYKNKERLRELMQKEQDYKNNKGMQECPPLTSTQQKQKIQLLQTGFRDWNKSDFSTFISASQKYGRFNYPQISRSVGKSIQQTTRYSQTFWSRLTQLSQHDKILRQMQTGQQKLQHKKQQYLLLQWKASNSLSIDFNASLYTKFKSKLFSIQADRYLADLTLKYKNSTKVKQKIKNSSMFRFDHYLRTRNQSQINKRMSSIYKLIEKQREVEGNIDRDVIEKEGKVKKRDRVWDEEGVILDEGKKMKRRR